MGGGKEPTQTDCVGPEKYIYPEWKLAQGSVAQKGTSLSRSSRTMRGQPFGNAMNRR